MLEEYNAYLRECWNEEPPVYIPDDLQEKIRNHPEFCDTPIGPVGDYIVSDQLRNMIPQWLSSAYIVTSYEDVPRLQEFISIQGGPQPTILTVDSESSMYSTIDDNEIVATESVASLRKNENPVIAKFLIDYFGTSTSKGVCVCV